VLCVKCCVRCHASSTYYHLALDPLPSLHTLLVFAVTHLLHKRLYTTLLSSSYDVWGQRGRQSGTPFLAHGAAVAVYDMLSCLSSCGLHCAAPACPSRTPLYITHASMSFAVSVLSLLWGSPSALRPRWKCYLCIPALHHSTTASTGSSSTL
jgi:hypothetical protein